METQTIVVKPALYLLGAVITANASLGRMENKLNEVGKSLNKEVEESKNRQEKALKEINKSRKNLIESYERRRENVERQTQDMH